MASGEGPFLTMAIFCEKALQDKDDVISLIRLFGRLTIRATGPGAPDTMPPMMQTLTLAVGFTAGAARGRHSLTIRTYAPSGLMLAESPGMPLLFESEDRGANAILTINLAVEQEGVYWFHVLLNGDVQTRVPLRIVYENVVTSS